MQERVKTTCSKCGRNFNELRIWFQKHPACPSCGGLFDMKELMQSRSAKAHKIIGLMQDHIKRVKRGI